MCQRFGRYLEARATLTPLATAETLKKLLPHGSDTTSQMTRTLNPISSVLTVPTAEAALGTCNQNSSKFNTEIKAAAQANKPGLP